MMGDKLVIGGKGTTTAAGMHVPLIANWPGQIAAGKPCADLIDSTDFVPTLLEAARVQPPPGVKFDGRSSLPQLRGDKGLPREWIYSWYSPRQSDDRTVREFAFYHDYKLYRSGIFFDLRRDLAEQQLLDVASLDGQAASAAKLLQGAFDQFVNARPKELDRSDRKAAPAKKKNQ